MDGSGRDVENALAAKREDAHGDIGQVVHENMVAAFLPVPEKNDVLPLIGQPTEAVGPVTVVGITDGDATIRKRSSN